MGAKQRSARTLGLLAQVAGWCPPSSTSSAHHYYVAFTLSAPAKASWCKAPVSGIHTCIYINWYIFVTHLNYMASIQHLTHPSITALFKNPGPFWPLTTLLFRGLYLAKSHVLPGFPCCLVSGPHDFLCSLPSLSVCVLLVFSANLLSFPASVSLMQGWHVYHHIWPSPP